MPHGGFKQPGNGKDLPMYSWLRYRYVHTFSACVLVFWVGVSTRTPTRRHLRTKRSFLIEYACCFGASHHEVRHSQVCGDPDA